jgi:hypothetical protein
MKTRLITAAAVMALASQGAWADQSATATAGTQAVVVKPITLTNAGNLAFGRLAAGAGTVTIAASDGARGGTDALLIALNGVANAPSRAAFAVAGEPGLAYSIAGGTGNIILQKTGDVGTTLTVTLTGVYVPSKNGGAGIATAGTLPATGEPAGTETLGVGGSLTLTDTTPSGTYTNGAGISLTVAYN